MACLRFDAACFFVFFLQRHQCIVCEQASICMRVKVLQGLPKAATLAGVVAMRVSLLKFAPPLSLCSFWRSLHLACDHKLIGDGKQSFLNFHHNDIYCCASYGTHGGASFAEPIDRCLTQVHLRDE